MRLCILFRCSSVSFELAGWAEQNLLQKASSQTLEGLPLSGLKRAEFATIALNLRRSNLLQPLPNSDDGW